MNVFGIGIDVVEVQRIASSMAEFGSRFAQKIFTESEREYCEGQKNPAIHYAARFAAKEAVAKALGTGIGKDLAWLDMEIRRRDSGEPEVFLSGDGEAFARSRGIQEIKISLTHAEHYAAANAVVLAE
ncbi:holo-ACP synthase [Verrucomicrobiaceae bacterium N1E253]|uniref:Holo-[acyl-carrier-protein] synthase n=1 Tax=Oceaniferula marina TaxID=2748318 RepID=A0A851GB70_9BACT|nr:holo-ACP synthase [Oceaniferula marina]NWK54666.1 holo-ACP synthase [Oceaniferula marina]